MPAELAGLVIALLILAPEGMAAIAGGSSRQPAACDQHLPGFWFGDDWLDDSGGI